LSPSTAHRYAELWRLHAAPRLGSIPVGRLRAAHVAVLYADLLSSFAIRRLVARYAHSRGTAR
jgi:hypothetical protein